MPLIVYQSHLQLSLMNLYMGRWRVSITQKKKTVSGIGGSHDTIVMLFQSIRDTKLCNGQLQISKKDISNELKGNIFT